MNRPNLFAFICSKAACEVLNAPVRWTSIIEFQSSSYSYLCRYHTMIYITWNSQEGPVAENSSVVDDNINLSKAIDGGFDELVTIGDRVVVSNSFASVRFDELDNSISGRIWRTITVSGSSEVVDNNARTSWSKLTIVNISVHFHSLTWRAYSLPRPAPAPEIIATCPSYLNWLDALTEEVLKAFLAIVFNILLSQVLVLACNFATILPWFYLPATGGVSL